MTLADLRAEVQRRKDTVHALEKGGPGEGEIGDSTFALPQAARFELHTIDRDYGVTFRRWDSKNARAAHVVVTVAQWDQWGRPVTITAEIQPGPVIVDGEPS